jgi:hypothetical protein
MKIYKPVYSKGVVLAGYQTRPFGWLVADGQQLGDEDENEDAHFGNAPIDDEEEEDGRTESEEEEDIF